MPTLLQRAALAIGLVPQAVARAQADEAAQQAATAATRRVLHLAGQQRRSLLAALTTGDVASWQADGLHINAQTAAGLVTVRARSRDAADNNGYAKRFLGMVHGNLLGQFGVRYQSRVRTANGELKTAVNDRLERGWTAFGRKGACDVTGRYSWPMIQRLVLRHVAVDGEHFVRFLPGRGPHGVQLQLLPADACPVSFNADRGAGVKVRQGVEFNADGRILAYHFRSDDSTIDSVGEWAGATQRLVRVPADDVLHVMLPEQVGQLRGVPWMSAALKRMYQAADFASAGLNKAREAAKRGGWLQLSADAQPPAEGALTDGADDKGKAYQSLHDGTWEQLPWGMTAQPFESDFPNIEYGQFIKDCVRDIAGALGTAYFTLGNDLEAVNYSSGQLGMEGERTMWLALQQWFIDDALVRAVHRRWLRYALVAAPELEGLAYDKLDLYADAARWQPHRWQPIDLKKTTDAQTLRIQARLTSPQRVIVESGDDPDEIIAELQEWNRKTAGLAPAIPSATPAQPAAQPQAADDEEGEDGAAARAALRLIASRAME
jgi:lambda family phage portal protein